jgi:DNA-binding GntR family transcriptional regulator
MKKHENRGSTTDIIYWTIREAIRTNIICSGYRLIELELADRLDISRTPVREALQRLDSEGLLQKEPRRGFVVPTITREDLIQIYEISEVLFGLAARLSAERVTQTEIDVMLEVIKRMELALDSDDIPDLTESSHLFHTMILSGTKNPRLQASIALLDDSHQSFHLTEYSLPDRIPMAILEHSKILDAIASRNGIRAEQLAREHVINALKAQLIAHRYNGTR